MPFPEPIGLLRSLNLRPKKSFGQNFIRDQNVVDRIAGLCPDTPGVVVEIGAGLGALSYSLLCRGHHVIAIERDRDLVPVLRELAQSEHRGTLEVLEADAKTVDLDALFASVDKAGPRLLLGNVPYNLTGVLLRKATESAANIDLAVFLVQREVCDRLAAPPDSDDYGALSVFAQAAFDVHSSFVVGRGAFYPAPNVDSRVVRLTPLRPPRAVETESFRALVKGAFEQRRKTLRNAWANVMNKNREEIAAAAVAAGISLDARGETLSVDDFRRMSEALCP